MLYSASKPLCKSAAVATPRCVSLLPVRRPVFSSKQRVRAQNSDSSGEATPVEDVVQQAPAAGAAAIAATPVRPGEASPFLDPLVRSLFLGVGAGIVCETLHVVLKVRAIS